MWLGDVVMVRLSRTCLHFSLRHFCGEASLWVLDTDLLATLRISNLLHGYENSRFSGKARMGAWGLVVNARGSSSSQLASSANIEAAEVTVIPPCSVECFWTDFVPHCKDINWELIRAWSMKSVCITLQIDDHNMQTPNTRLAKMTRHHQVTCEVNERQ